MNAIINLDRVTISFRRQLIFDDLNHAFERGCHLLLGQNGAGKSTLLGAIAGSVRYKGHIRIDGHEITNAPVSARRMLAYVPDSATFYPFVTGTQFADFFLRAHDQTMADRKQYARIIGRLDMVDDLDTPFSEASLGTRKKFFLLGALLLAPKVLILDEPFNGLDAAASRASRYHQ